LCKAAGEGTFGILGSFILVKEIGQVRNNKRGGSFWGLDVAIGELWRVEGERMVELEGEKKGGGRKWAFTGSLLVEIGAGSAHVIAEEKNPDFWTTTRVQKRWEVSVACRETILSLR